VSLPEISARIRRLQGEPCYRSQHELSDQFLRACIEDGLSDDHIVMLAREHKPTKERFKPNEDSVGQQGGGRTDHAQGTCHPAPLPSTERRARPATTGTCGNRAVCGSLSARQVDHHEVDAYLRPGSPVG